MPVLVIYGMPSSVKQEHLERVVSKLQVEVAASLELEPSEVSVFMPADLMQKGLGEELICIVQGLFERPERTNEVRWRMAAVIRECLYLFVHDHSFGTPLENCRKVEVIVNRFHQDVDGFAMCKIGPAK